MDHTPGPWKADQRKHHPWHIQSSEGTVAYVFGTAMKGTKIQQEANARLIASAPELIARERTRFQIFRSVLRDYKQARLYVISETSSSIKSDKAKLGKSLAGMMKSYKSGLSE